MPPNIGFAQTSATLNNGMLTVSGLSDQVFVTTGSGVPEEGVLVSRSVAVQQDGQVYGGPGTIDDSKDWSATFEAPGFKAGVRASASGSEVLAFAGQQAPLLATFTWSQDITIA